STLDFSNEALDAADKGYKRLMTAISLLDKLKVSKGADSFNLAEIRRKCYAAMDDDFNSPVLIAELFEIVRIINSIYDGKAKVTAEGLEGLKLFMKEFVEDILGLRNDQTSASDDIDDVMNLVIKLRNEAKANKDFVTSDRIRDELNSIGIQLKDSKEGTLWNKI
ncbi:MAG TPA: cysteine--tRNA ligase, partial [Sphingobacterium sp.]|nr:cysteine--tRNA ligase [Sphingobacterium sp.]